MGFPNGDRILANLFIDVLQKAQRDVKTVVDDVFAEDSPADRADVMQYLQRLTVAGDTQLKSLSATDRYLYVLSSHPLADVPLPQIGVYVGTEDPDAMFVGDDTGETVPVRNSTGDIIGYNIQKGYMARAVWHVEVLAAHKSEVVWLSRLCQWAIFTNLLELQERNIMEVAVAPKDLKIEESTLQPQGIFARLVIVSARVLNTWNIRSKPVQISIGRNGAV